MSRPLKCQCGVYEQSKKHWDGDIPITKEEEYEVFHYRKPNVCQWFWTLKGVQNIVSNISFCPGGTIENQRAFTVRSLGMSEVNDNFALQLKYLEPDVRFPHSPPSVQYSREWLLNSGMTETEIVETVWAACQRSMYHVTAEWFLYKEQRIYSPHFDVEERLALCAQKKAKGGEHR